MMEIFPISSIFIPMIMTNYALDLNESDVKPMPRERDRNKFDEKSMMDYVEGYLETDFPAIEDVDCDGKPIKPITMKMDSNLTRFSRRELHVHYQEFLAVLRQIDLMKQSKKTYALHEFRVAVDRLYFVVDHGMRVIVDELAKPDKSRAEELRKNSSGIYDDEMM